MAGQQEWQSPEIECLERQERALGLDGEISSLESTNVETLGMLAGIAPAGYVEALAAGAALPPLDETLDLAVRTRIRQLTDRYTGNKSIMAEYADERAKLATTMGADLAACKLDAATDREELDRRIGRLIEAKFAQLATALMDRADLGNKFYVYQYEGEGGYAVFSRVPDTGDFSYDGDEDLLYGRDRMTEDELFFPVDPTESPSEAARDGHGYFFSMDGSSFRTPDRTWDMAAVDKYLRTTPDDILRMAESLLGLMREADRRNAEILADARRLVDEINADESLDYGLEISQKGRERGQRIEFFSKNSASSRFLTYFTIPAWQPEGEGLKLHDDDNKLTREYADGIAASLRKQKRL